MTTVDRAPAAEQPPEPPPGAGWSETWMGGSPEAERRILARALPGIEHIQDVVARRQKTEIRRAFHNKGTVVAIQFDVAPDLPPHLRAPFLEPRASFPGFARFSRSQSVRQRDRDRDQRGFAFRIETPAGAQDILLSNTPTSFARDPVQFLKVTTAFAEGPLALAVVKVILALGVPEGVRVLRDLLRAPDRTISFTTQRYWSRTAFQLGEVAIRLFVRPLAQADHPPQDA